MIYVLADASGYENQSSAMTSDVMGAAIDVHRDKGQRLRHREKRMLALFPLFSPVQTT